MHSLGPNANKRVSHPDALCQQHAQRVQIGTNDDVYANFKERFEIETTDGPIPCLSTFVKWRPFYITKGTQKTCVCVHHMTTDLLVQCLRENWNKVHCRTLVGDDGKRTCACTCEFCDNGMGCGYEHVETALESAMNMRDFLLCERTTLEALGAQSTGGSEGGYQTLVWMEHARLATGLITPCGSALD
ncbi:unnamed protein product [Choristocarpus tenellus]